MRCFSKPEGRSWRKKHGLRPITRTEPTLVLQFSFFGSLTENDAGRFSLDVKVALFSAGLVMLSLSIWRPHVTHAGSRANGQRLSRRRPLCTGKLAESRRNRGHEPSFGTAGDQGCINGGYAYRHDAYNEGDSDLPDFAASAVAVKQKVSFRACSKQR